MTSHSSAMRAIGPVAVAAVLMCAAAWPVRAQSLGDVAREAEARREAVKGSGKVYTNEDLRPDPSASSGGAAPASAAAPPSQSGVAPPEPDAKDEPAKDEEHWRQRIKTERDALARAEAFAAALQSQINGLYAEFTACQAPPQCNQISANRQKAMGELDRVKKEVQDHTKAVADIQEEARRAGVPAGWVR